MKIVWVIGAVLLSLVESRRTYLVGVEPHHQRSVLKKLNKLVISTSTHPGRHLLATALKSIIPNTIKIVKMGELMICIVQASSSLHHLNRMRGVRFVEKDQPLYTSSLLEQGGSPSYGLSRISSREVVPNPNYVYDETAGEGVDVYVLDSGINTQHSDFGGRAYLSRNFVTSEGDEDFYGHGTHVAGTVAGERFGVAKRARVFGVKILNRFGEGTVSLAIQAISHAMTEASNTNRRSIINLSLSGFFSQALNLAVDQASESNIPVVVAAGNQRTNACLTSPASAFHVIAVGNIDQHNKLSPTSNTGPCVAIFAPGAKIISTSNHGTSDLRTLSGTSMAAPHVSGVLALYWSQRPQLTTTDLYHLLQSHATRNLIPDLPLLNPNLIVYNQLSP